MQLAQLDFYQAAQDRNLPGVPDNVSSASDRGFGEFLGSILSGVMVVAALLLLLYLIWGALDWITSGGEAGKVQKARDKMTQGVIGLVVLASTLAIYFIVQSYLGLNIINTDSSGPGPGAATTRSTRTLPGGAATGGSGAGTWPGSAGSVNVNRGADADPEAAPGFPEGAADVDGGV